jgi:hypothetical protein
VTLLKPDNQFYKDFALDCSRQQIAVDLFLFSPHYTDVATLSTAFPSPHPHAASVGLSAATCIGATL